MQEQTPKLSIDLVPRTSFYKSVRSQVPKSQWNKIRKIVYQEFNYKCETCGVDEEKFQGNKKGWLHCDEVWSFDNENKIQKLIGLRAICLNCHLAKHSGLAGILGLGKQAFEHLLKVNNWSEKEGREHKKIQWDLWAERNNYHWNIDYSYIEQYKMKIFPHKLLNLPVKS